MAVARAGATVVIGSRDAATGEGVVHAIRRGRGQAIFAILQWTSTLAAKIDRD